MNMEKINPNIEVIIIKIVILIWESLTCYILVFLGMSLIFLIPSLLPTKDISILSLLLYSIVYTVLASLVFFALTFIRTIGHSSWPTIREGNATFGLCLIPFFYKKYDFVTSLNLFPDTIIIFKRIILTPGSSFIIKDNLLIVEDAINGTIDVIQPVNAKDIIYATLEPSSAYAWYGQNAHLPATYYLNGDNFKYSYRTNTKLITGVALFIEHLYNDNENSKFN
ncbi:hypothetical protein [Caldisericum exile]|nr:hypothetical protein [Caldisericum exile]